MKTKNKNPLTIGIVLPYLKSRGTETQALKLTKGFIKKKARVIIFIIQGWGDKEMYDKFYNTDAEIIDLGHPKDVGIKDASFWRVFKLAKKVRSKRCDILLSRAGISNNITVAAGLLTFTPVITVLSGQIPAVPPCKFLLKKAYLTMRAIAPYLLAKKIVTVSANAAEKLVTLYPFLRNRTCTIQNGIEPIDTSYPPPALPDEPADVTDSSRFNICYSGNLEIDRKGLDVLIRAMRRLVYKHDQYHVKLLLIGSGPDEEKLKHLITEAGLEKYVTFTGEHNPPFPLMVRCQAFVLPSRREGFPNSLLEAMALEMCAIASDCGSGASEIISNGDNGFLVPLEDSAKLADKLLHIMQDKNLRKRVAENGRKTVEHNFSAQKMINSYYALIEETVK